jgi:tetratricopeptide (TPR) repeat protein
MSMKKLTYTFLTLLVALMIGCSSSNPLVDEAKSNIESKNYKAALASAEKSIEQHPGDPMGYYYKAAALGSLAETIEDPTERAEYYKRMNETFDLAEQVADTAESVPSEIKNIPAYKNVLWQSEHNRAVQLATDDSLKSAVEDHLGKSVQHLKNATMIQPDSSLSWGVLSQVAAMNKDFEEAAGAKEHYMSMVPDTSVKATDYLQLASYYYNLERNDKVVEVFEKAQEQYPTNEDIVSNLADAYNRINKPQKALSVVEELVEQNPDNPQYHLVLGTQVYQQAMKLGDTLSENSDQILDLRSERNKASASEKEEINTKIENIEKENAELESRIDELTTRAEKELKTTLEYRPNDADVYNTLGIIYQNKAKAIFDKRNRTMDNEKAAELDNQGKDLLRESLKYYKNAAEINPENKEYWKSLFQIYTALGMDKKAKEAMNKAGMN